MTDTGGWTPSLIALRDELCALTPGVDWPMHLVQMKAEMRKRADQHLDAHVVPLLKCPETIDWIRRIALDVFGNGTKKSANARLNDWGSIERPPEEYPPMANGCSSCVTALHMQVILCVEQSESMDDILGWLPAQ